MNVPWHTAVREGSIPAINEFLSQSPLLLMDENGQSKKATYEAAYHQQFEVVDYLLKHKAYQQDLGLDVVDPGIVNKSKYALVRDAMTACYEAARKLAKEGEIDKAQISLEKMKKYFVEDLVITEPSDWATYGHALRLLASILIRKKEEKEAVETLTDAIFALDKTKKNGLEFNNLVAIISCATDLANLHIRAKNLGQALEAIKKALAYCGQLPHSDPVGKLQKALQSKEANIMKHLIKQIGIFKPRNLTPAVCAQQSLIHVSTEAAKAQFSK